MKTVKKNIRNPARILDQANISESFQKGDFREKQRKKSK